MNKGFVINAMTVSAIALATPAGVQAADSGGPSSVSKLGGIEEVVVTSQRRSENVQDVPIAVTAVTANALIKEGVTKTDSLGQAIPGLTMTRQTGGLQPWIRGVGTQTVVAGNENATAAYVDGVYMQDAWVLPFSFNNIERIEVLKGPQGTLFGRNATGGLINIITSTPSSTPSVRGSLSYGNYDTVSGALYATGGNDTVAADIALYDIHQGKGFGRQIPTGKDVNLQREYGARTKVQWTPTDSDTITLALDYNANESDLGQTRQILPGAVAFGGNVAKGSVYDTIGTSSHIDDTAWGASVQYERDFGDVTLHLLSAYRDNHVDRTYDQDSTPVDLAQIKQNQRSNSTQNEVYLSGESGALQWTSGVFLFNAYAAMWPLGAMSSVAPASNTDLYTAQRTNSYAAYAQGTYAIFEDTNFTAGYRYTVDKRNLSGSRYAAPGNTVPAGTPLATNVQDDTFKSPSWRLALDHKFTDRLMGYLSYNRGFKSGVFNVTSPAAPAVKPETLDAYEVGLKSEWFDHRLLVNMAAFHYKYQDIQITTVQGGIASYFNAASSEMNGAEIEAQLATQIGAGEANFRVGAAFLDAHYKDFPSGPVNTPNPAGGNVQTFADLSDNTMIRAPKTTVNASVNYSLPFYQHELGFNAAYYYNSGFYWEPDNRLKQDPYSVVNASVYYTFGDGDQYRVTLFGNNVFDKRYYIYQSENSFGDTGAAAPPRTYGVRFGFEY